VLITESSITRSDAVSDATAALTVRSLSLLATMQVLLHGTNTDSLLIVLAQDSIYIIQYSTLTISHLAQASAAGSRTASFGEISRFLYAVK
jgi:hypothetical protein